MTDSAEPVLLDVTAEGVAFVTLNRPAKHNAFDEEMIAKLADAFETLKGADHVRIVFIRGNGPSFCAGADIQLYRPFETGIASSRSRSQYSSPSCAL